MSYANKIQSIIQELNKGLLERDEVIKLVLLAFFSGKSIFLYGPPGTAKSMIARRSALAFGEDNHFFTYLMNRFSTPEEVFGPIDIKALKENKLKRVTKGYLPCANFAFLDEIWKSSPAILNTLLTIINEKIYKDGEDNIEVPLYGLICASNEFPATNQGLEALYDRMLIRYEVLPLEQRESFENLLRNKSEKIMIKNHFQAEELQKILIESENVEFPDEAMEILLNIKSDIELHNQNLEDIDELIYISDRRYKNIAQLLKVCAYLNDRKEILPIDLALLEHCLWSNEKDKKIIKQILQENFTHEVDEKEFLRVKNILLALEDEINKACYHKNGKAKKIDQATKNEFLSKLQRIQKEFLNLKQNLEDEFNQLKNKNKNIFLSEYSYKTFFASYDELFKAIKQELLKTEQIQHDINNLEQSSKKINTNKNYPHTPTTKEQLKDLVSHLSVNLADIDVSNITDMSYLFKNSRRQDFSGIEEWDVSNVTNMCDMFKDCENFNHDISNWDVSNVTNMSGMFYGAKNFNHDISNWDVSNVTNMSGMFYGCESFDQPLEKWDVSNVTNMGSMFQNAKNFNQPLENWNVSSVENMQAMFMAGEFNIYGLPRTTYNTVYFNQPLNTWDVSKVKDMSCMFYGNKCFNQPLAYWDVSNVKYMERMFEYSAQNPLPYWYKG
ncbi:BspA family leucine-rich repeat surface protein [Campylobacter sp. CNRCH_2015_1657]|uniref:BspA family leucine-rich repeat surface protein n=2 Tax=unclassified Campylobacter TaxID=2593542 RepID=UPI0021E6AF2C|nr:BspA family leucine-rich repeat surface protein [Campylobacter sp. CNRCH_2015_1657]MCV3479462.1 BspA family leucine-rich repeat surface protein [Campylobacter sp. CNRCH_2015_1657]